MREITYDKESYNLACYFLADSSRPATEADKVELARMIQAVIEDWLSDFEEEPT